MLLSVIAPLARRSSGTHPERVGRTGLAGAAPAVARPPDEIKTGLGIFRCSDQLSKSATLAGGGTAGQFDDLASDRFLAQLPGLRCQAV